MRGHRALGGGGERERERDWFLMSSRIKDLKKTY